MEILDTQSEGTRMVVFQNVDDLVTSRASTMLCYFVTANWNVM